MINDSEINDAGLETRATLGDRANPILLSDTDTDQDKELAKIADCTVGIRHAEGETVIEKNSVSCSADPTCRSRRLNMSQAQRSSLHTYQELSKNVFKHTPASVLLADLVNHRRATSSTLSTTNSRNDGKLPRERRRRRCGQNNPASASNPRFQDSISDENNKATSTVPAQDVSAEISSLEDLSANPTFLKSHTRGKSCIADIGSRDQARSARKNRSPKRKQTQNLPSEGNAMVQQQNESHSTSTGNFEWFHIVPHIDAIWEYLVSVDDIAEKLKDLDINGETGIQRQQCSALGPYGTSYQTKSILECRWN
uniref:Uncharacterized protein n=1 Tax=Kalanchoe fedtschenkoi TaxID=63787 RepID=A0A7N0T0Q0_KALFE